MKKALCLIKPNVIHRLTYHALFFAAIGIAGCAQMAASVQSGDSPEAIRAQLGEPTLKLALNDGSTAWYYTGGPMGLRTTKVVFNAQQKSTLIHQTLKDDVFNQIQTQAWNEDRVLALLGPPSRTVQFDRSKTTAWDYRYQDDWGYLSEYSIIFNSQGLVVSKAQQRLDKYFDSIGGP